MRPLKTEVAIVGGGLVGCSAALFLRRHGVPVVLLDAARCGSKASGVNYGGVRRQGRALNQMPMAMRAHAIWQDIKSLIGTDGEYVRSGHLKLARTASDLAELERYKETTRAFDMDLQILGPAQLSQKYGWLGDSMAGASLCPDDGSANPRLISPAFALAAQRSGAVIWEDAAVTHIAREGDAFVVQSAVGEVRAKHLINAAGAWAGQFAKLFGEPVPESTIHPQMLVTEAVPQFMSVSIGMQGAGIYARQVSRGNIVLGGGRTDGDQTELARPARANMAALLERAVEVIPHLGGVHVMRFWSGVEGKLPDNNPVIGPSMTTPDLYHAFGLCGAGFQVGPAIGEALADLIVLGESRFSLEPYRIERFAHKVSQQDQFVTA